MKAAIGEPRTIKDHPLSKVWIEDDGSLYKWQPKFLTDNEIYCLEMLFPTGFVPYAERVELEVIKMDFITDEPPTDNYLLLKNTKSVLIALSQSGIRHGDLTRPNVLIVGNVPIILDFAESRLAADPRPDKRPEGDRYWLYRTIQEMF